MKTILLTMLVVLGLTPLSHAYSLGGPIGNGGDKWQVPEDGFGPPRDDEAPKNIGEGYRRNVPVVFYACDANFLDYFGSSGEQSIDAAFVILNNVFTNNPTGTNNGLDGYSPSLQEFPTTAQSINYTAETLGLWDLKSYTLNAMMYNLGLADPLLYIWNIHDWYHVGAVACPAGQEYLIVQRNYDITSTPANQLQYSAYVNDAMFSYDIIEDCSGDNPVRLPEPVLADVDNDAYEPVATGDIYWGSFYTGLTRDDVAGLRYLMKANTLNEETISADSVYDSITTNANAQVPFPPYISGATNYVSGTNSSYYIFYGSTNSGYGYGDYYGLLAFSKTNGPAALAAAYPGLVATLITNNWIRVTNYTVVSYYTNGPVGSPYGSTVLVVTSNLTGVVFLQTYQYTFGNVFVNITNATGVQSLITTTVSAPIGSPYGSAVGTNSTVVTTHVPSGDFFVLPLFYTNVCPIDIASQFGSIPTVLAYTNMLTTTSTNTGSTNLTSSTYLVNYFTNYTYIINPVSCTPIAGETALYEGIEKIQFIGTNDYDSLLSQYFYPITNYYTMKFVTNKTVQVQYIERVVTTPDYLFSAADMVAGPNAIPLVTYMSQSLNFDQANILPGLAGPGTITSPTTYTFNKSGGVYFNSATSLTGTPYWTKAPGDDNTVDEYFNEYFAWGSFDMTTNIIVFPNGNSIDNVANQLLVTVSPTGLTNGISGTAYGPVDFTATSTFFTTPYTWSSTALPDGMSFTSDGELAGTPTTSGDYDFTITLTDSNSRTVQWYYTITIQ